MIKFTHSGNFNNTERFLRKAKMKDLKTILLRYGEQGVAALSSATPLDSGETANSWTYSVSVSKYSASVNWSNTNVSDGIPIVVLIQYGHVANGAYVYGRDFINPTIQPIFDEIVNNVWKEVTS